MASSASAPPCRPYRQRRWCGAGLLQSWETGSEHADAFPSAMLVLSDHEPESAIVRRLLAQVPVALIPGAGGKICF
jgi:hypothetical protein